MAEPSLPGIVEAEPPRHKGRWRDESDILRDCAGAITWMRCLTCDDWLPATPENFTRCGGATENGLRRKCKPCEGRYHRDRAEGLHLQAVEAERRRALNRARQAAWMHNGEPAGEVYELWWHDKDGPCVYVGASAHPDRRLDQHRLDSSNPEVRTLWGRLGRPAQVRHQVAAGDGLWAAERDRFDVLAAEGVRLLNRVRPPGRAPGHLQDSPLTDAHKEET